MYFVPFFSSNEYISYRIQAMHSSIIQNIERVELKLNSREHTNDSTSTNNKMVVDSLIIRFSVHINLLRFHLEIHSFFED